MDRINGAVLWYQHKIGTYDKQLWERSVEKKVLKSIYSVPKKTVKNKPELIDVDLVRGSTFPKAKPQHGLLAVVRIGLSRVLLLPLYYRWWHQQTNTLFTVLLIFSYVLQVATLWVYCCDYEQKLTEEFLSQAHMATPILMMLILGLMHAHIVATHELYRPRRKAAVESPRSKVKPKKPSKEKTQKKSSSSPSCQSERDSGSHDTGIEVNQDGVIGLRQRKFTSKTLLNRRRSGSLYSGTQSGKKEGNRSDEADDESEEGSKFTKVTKEVKVTNKEDKVKSRSEDEGHSHSLYKDRDRWMCACGNTSVDNISLGETPNLFVHHNQCKYLTQKSDECLSMGLGVGTGSKPTSHSCEARISENDAEQLGDASDDKEQESGAVDSVYAACTFDSPQGVCEEFSEITGQLVSNPEMVRKISEGVSEFSEAGLEISEAGLKNSEVGFDACESKLRGLNECPEKSDMLTDSGMVTRNETDSNSENSHLLEGANFEKLRESNPNCVKNCGTFVSSIDAETAAPSTKIDEMAEAERAEIPLENCHKSTPFPVKNCTLSSPKKPVNLNLRRGRHLKDLSSCDSEADATTPQKNSPQLLNSETEWGDIGHTDMTSCGDTSSNTVSDSELTDATASQEAKESASATGGMSGISNVMNNLASSSDKVSCMIWEGEEVKKLDLTVLDIGWVIIQKVDKIPETCDYLVVGFIFSVMLAALPIFFRTYHSKMKFQAEDTLSIVQEQIQQAQQMVFGDHWSQAMVVSNGMIQRCFLGFILFFLLSVAERTFKQRLLYAKHFCYLTSSRRAKKYEMPHFRLNKVRNIKTWFSLRSYLKKRGPQRSVDTIVSAAFLLEVILISIMCFQLLQDSENFLDHLGNWELVLWCMALAIYLLRFMTLGTKINKKYRNFSVLITEQINLYLQMEQKPHKKDELMMANSVLKLAEALLKELEIPFKISGLSANPFLYNITKVILLSAFSAVLTELLGFKLKLYKIKLRA